MVRVNHGCQTDARINALWVHDKTQKTVRGSENNGTGPNQVAKAATGQSNQLVDQVRWVLGVRMMRSS